MQWNNCLFIYDSYFICFVCSYVSHEHMVHMNIWFTWTYGSYEHMVHMNIWFIWTYVSYERMFHMNICFTLTYVSHEHTFHMNIRFIWTYVSYEHMFHMNICFICSHISNVNNMFYMFICTFVKFQLKLSAAKLLVTNYWSLNFFITKKSSHQKCIFNYNYQQSVISMAFGNNWCYAIIL